MRHASSFLRAGLVFLLGMVAAFAEEPAPFGFSDDFSKYAPGGDGSPAWAAESIGWEVRDGRFQCAVGGKDSALVAAAPLGARVTVQADLRLRGTTVKGWKVAGLCVQKDDRNFWHLALVEGPDEQGKRHFVELSEMLDGTWLAQSQAATKLAPKDSQGQDLNWEYDRAYRLSIELTPEGITGQVKELDGTVRASMGFAFGQAKAVACGRPGLTAGGLKGEFSAFSTKVGQPVTPEAKEKTMPPPYESRGFTQVKGKATGFFHVEKLGETWWAMDPAGNGFFFVGTDHANYNCHWCEKLGYAPYHRNCEKLYGSEQKWSDSTLARLKEWGFNSLGVSSSLPLRRRGLPHPEFLSFGTGFTDYDYITQKTTWTGFPNVFSPKWPSYCDKQARRLCTPLKDDPWIIGYFLDNELEWHPWTGSGLWGDTWKKPADHTAKIALVEMLKSRYPTAEALNAAWGTKIADFAELLKLTTPLKSASPATDADVREWTRLVAEKYFSVCAAAIRKHDPNHMILGCRFAGSAPEIVDTAGKYCDIFSINCYRTVDLEQGVMADGFEQDLKRWYEQSGRPLMITEWSFPALDAGLPCKHGAGQRVPTQVEKTFAFTVFQKLLFGTPYVVGSNYFMWADEPALGISSTFPEDSNYGLVNEQDKPYELLTQAAAKLHPLVYAIHDGQMTDLSVKPGAAQGSWLVANAGKAAGKCKLTVWTDGKAQERELDLAPGATQSVEPPAGALAAPGGHFVVAQLEPANALLERSPADHLATQCLYVPGAPWADEPKGATARIPLVVANPLDKPLDATPLVLKWDDLRKDQKIEDLNRLAVKNAATGQAVPFQVDRLEGSTELTLLVKDVGPRAAKTLFVYLNAEPAPRGEAAVKYRETERGFEADNGALTLARTDPDKGNAFDRIALRGLELGRFSPLVWQQADQSLWVGPSRVEKVEVSNGPVRLVLDLTFARVAGGETKTRVDEAGKQAATQARERRFRTKYRFTLYPGCEWFTSQLVWLENADERPLDVGAYYHYLPSNIGGKADDDETGGAYWTDKAAGVRFGIVSDSREIAVYFWKDNGGGEHPDAARKLGLTLKPGERYARPEPVAYVIGCKEGDWNQTAKRVTSQQRVVTRGFNPESK